MTLSKLKLKLRFFNTNFKFKGDNPFLFLPEYTEKNECIFPLLYDHCCNIRILIFFLLWL